MKERRLKVRAEHFCLSLANSVAYLKGNENILLIPKEIVDLKANKF